MPEARSIKIGAFVAATAAAASALTVAWTKRYPWGPAVNVVHAAAFAGALTAAALLVLDVRHRNETMSISLFEAVLAPALIAFPGPVVVLLAASAQLISETQQRVRPIKASFNVAQWALAAIVGSFAYRLAGGTANGSGRSFIAVAAALTAMAAVNTIMFTVIVAVAQHTPMRRIAATHAPANLLGWAVNGAFGVLFFAAHRTHPAAVVLFFVPLAALHVGLRGYAGAVADRRRLTGLHKATQALSVPMNPLDAMPQFMDEVRACFRAARAELVMAVDDGTRVYRSHDPHSVGGEGEALSVIVSIDATATGTLTVVDRVRVDDGDHGDRSVLEAMARAAGQAVHKAILLERILEERRTHADIVDHTSDGICTITAGGIVESWNPAFEAITNMPAAHMAGQRSIAAIRPRTETGDDVPLERWAAETIPPPHILTITTADGTLRTLACSYTIVPAAEGRDARMIIVGRDTTQAREVERMREDFVAAVSHELRTPLTPIKGFAETLVRRGAAMEQAARDDIARTIGRQADRLERLIINLLEMTKVERGMRERPDGVVDASAVAEKVAADFRAAIPGRDVVVSCEPGAVARGDGLWVEQVLANLLSNAIKYSPPAMPVRIAVTIDHGDVVIEVTDHGPGIAPQERERVFERFRRLTDDRTRSTGGAGIGLYISRRLARIMDGDLVVGDSDEGTRMVLTLRNARRLAAVG